MRGGGGVVLLLESYYSGDWVGASWPLGRSRAGLAHGLGPVGKGRF
jgi:hypothetical protein